MASQQGADTLTERRVSMARRASEMVQPDPETPDIDEAMVTTAPDDWEWETVSEESPIGVVFENVGDVFIGKYLGPETITTDKPYNSDGDTSFDVFLFRGRDEKRYSMPQSYNLMKAMEKVQEGQWCRIEFCAEVETKRGQNPMKDFRVDVRKS